MPDLVWMSLNPTKEVYFPHQVWFRFCSHPVSPHRWDGDDHGDDNGWTFSDQGLIRGTFSMEQVHEGGSERERGFRVTCMLGRGRGRVPAQDLRSSSRARLSISNCLSCSRTEASREAVLAHCSIHTLRAEDRTGQGQHQRQKRFNQHWDLTKEQTYTKMKSPKYTERKTKGDLAPYSSRNAHNEVLMKLIFWA